MLTYKAQSKIAAMEVQLWEATKRDNANVRGSLGDLYTNWIGYNCFEDNEEMTTDEAIEVLADYIKEFRYACMAGLA